MAVVLEMAGSQDWHSALAEAHAAYGRGELAQTETWCRIVLAMQPKQTDALFLLGYVMLKIGHAEIARPFFQAALRSEPRRADLYVGIGLCDLQSKRVDSAIAAFRQALEIDPIHTDAWTRLGHLYLDLGRNHEALETFNQHLSRDATNQSARIDQIISLLILGMVDDATRAIRDLGAVDDSMLDRLQYRAFTFHALGQQNRAIATARFLSLIDPTSSEFTDLLNRLLQNVPLAQPPGAYAEVLFDTYADSFDHHLQDVLQYQTPQLIKEFISRELGPPRGSMQVLDLGCGTGLCGPALRPYAQRLVGVDLSTRMLDKARARGAYDDLVEADIRLYSPAAENRFDLIVLADVLVYLGDLDGVLHRLSMLLSDGGLLMLTVEKTDETGYILQPSGRYAHSTRYLQKLALTVGLNELAIEPSVLRLEFGKPVDGYLCAFVRSEKGRDED